MQFYGHELLFLSQTSYQSVHFHKNNTKALSHTSCLHLSKPVFLISIKVVIHFIENDDIFTLFLPLLRKDCYGTHGTEFCGVVIQGHGVF